MSRWLRARPSPRVRRAPAPAEAEAAGDRRLRWRLRAPVAVAFARLRARPGRAMLVVMGVAAAAGLLVAVLGGSLAAQDRELQRTVASLPVTQRTFRIDAFGLPTGESYARADSQARAALATLTTRPPLVVTSFPTLLIDGELVRLAGIDALPRTARLVSGRWPRVCDPARCEVVQVGAGGEPLLSEGGIRLVRVGFAVVPDRSAFGASLTTSSPDAQSRRPVLLLADGAGSFERLAAFQPFYRTYSWIAPFDPDRFQIWQIPGILARESDVQATLAQASAVYQLTGPDQALLTAQQQARVAAQRIVLVGGEISALLLGFAFVAAVGLRRGVANESRRLAARGARRMQVWLALTAEVGCMTLGGALVGVAAGIVSVAAIADATGLPGAALVGHSLGSPVAVGIVAALWLVATLVIVAAASSLDTRTRGVRLSDTAALGAAAAVVIGLASTNTDPAQLSTSASSRLLLTLLPGLICFAAAVLAGRLLGPAMRTVERLARDAPRALRLAALALARAPARTVATAGFLIVSIGLALFAASYRATLERGAFDEAGFAVPLDFTLTEGTRLVLPLQIAPLAGYDALAPGLRAYPILRRTANIAGSGTSVLSPTVLGVPPAALRASYWRSDFSSLSQTTLATRIGVDGPAALRGVALPAGTRALELGVRIRGVPVMLELALERSDQQVAMLDLGERPAGNWRLVAALPHPDAGARIIALEVSQQALDQFGSTHRAAEGSVSVVPAGSATLGVLTANLDGPRRVALTAWSGWIARDGGQLAPGAQPRLAYDFSQGQTVIVRLRQPTDARPLPVVVSANIASAAPPGGAITLNFQDADLPAQIVGVASAFPASDDLGQGFVIADESRLATALGADAPGTATPDELWLAAPGASAKRVAADLARPPFSALDLASRREIERQLATNPLARGITLTLVAASILSLALAAIGFWVTLLSDARDERGELFDLEAQGVRPEVLRQQLRLRSLMLLAFGTVGGLALGLVLARLVVSVIAVSAETTVPVPPLVYQAGWPTVLVGLAVFLAVAIAVTELTVRNALKGDTPARASWSLA